MQSREAALAHTASAMRHLTADGLPPFPPPRPWPAPPPALAGGELWVFGYGSLTWHPGFPHAETQLATLYGFHRRLCVWSWEYRGTAERPGLVLGLDLGGSCRGLAFRLPKTDRAACIAYLLRRELTARVYRPVRRAVTLRDGRRVSALTFVVDRSAHQYAAPMSMGALRRVVARARGCRGANREYVVNTHHRLSELGIPCPRLGALVASLPP